MGVMLSGKDVPLDLGGGRKEKCCLKSGRSTGHSSCPLYFWVGNILQLVLAVTSSDVLLLTLLCTLLVVVGHWVMWLFLTAQAAHDQRDLQFSMWMYLLIPQ